MIVALASRPSGLALPCNSRSPMLVFQFADCARQVMTHARVNASLLPDRLRVRQLEKEVERLRALLADQAGRGPGSGVNDKVLMLEAENRHMQESNDRLVAALQSQGIVSARSSGGGGGVGAGGGGAGGGGGITVGGAFIPAFSMGVAASGSNPHRDAELEAEKAKRQVLEETLTEVQALTGKFFELEIEEDDLRKVRGVCACTRRACNLAISHTTSSLSLVPILILPCCVLGVHVCRVW